MQIFPPLLRVLPLHGMEDSHLASAVLAVLRGRASPSELPGLALSVVLDASGSAHLSDGRFALRAVLPGGLAASVVEAYGFAELSLAGVRVAVKAGGWALRTLPRLLGVGAELAAPENRQNGNRIVIAGRDSAQDSINQVGQEMTRRNMNIQPTLTERPGLPVRIIVNRDLVLRPYQPMFFQRGAMR